MRLWTASHPIAMTVIPPFSAQVVTPDSPAFQAAQVFRSQRFARASKPDASPPASAKPSVRDTFPLVISRQQNSAAALVVATATLELASVGTIQTMIRFQPGSLSAHILEQKAFMLLRGVAVAFDIDQSDIPDIFDTLGHSILQIARRQKPRVEWLWVVPRRPIVALARAEIPGILPPYHFDACADVAGWVDEGVGVQEIRQMQLKELSVDERSLPPLFQISLTRLEQDMAARLALLEKRHKATELSRLLREATRQANRRVVSELEFLNQQKWEGEHPPQERQTSGMASPKKDGKETTIMNPPEERGSVSASPARGSATFLPVAGTSADEARYLHQVMERGGVDAQRYKTLSYELLHLKPGMQVLDVGCGIGVDLPPLADAVGESGLVIGLDHNPDLVREASEKTAGQSNIRAVIGEAERLPFPHQSFDRVRADRVLQHIADLKQVLAEMGRVLRPGGILSIVEPDWKMVAIHPGSSAGGDNDHTLYAVLAYKQRISPHALVGRQLSSLLRQQGNTSWEDIRVQAEVFTFNSWPVVDAGLLVSGMAQEVAKAEPALADEISAWLKAIETADAHGEFLASMQLFYASARKVATPHM